MTQRWINSPSWPASPQLMTISAFCIRLSITLNCCSYVGFSISLIPNRGGIIGSDPRLQRFQFSAYSCGSFRVHKCPNPFPSIYPFIRWVAPNTSAISRATLGFSAIQTFINTSSFLKWTDKNTWLFPNEQRCLLSWVYKAVWWSCWFWFNLFLPLGILHTFEPM